MLLPMTVQTGGGRERLDLEGCPASESIRWVVERLSPGSARADSDEVMRHIAVDPEMADTAAEMLVREAGGHGAIAEVTGWRVAANGRVVLRFAAVDGRTYELSWRVSADGRLEDQRCQREDTEAEITGARTADLSDETRAQLHAVFSAAYTDPDPEYLDSQLASLQGIGYATDLAGEVIGFTLYGWRELDLPVVGVHGVGLPGLMCVNPTVRRTGVGRACGNAAGMVALGGPLHLSVMKLATPASLRMALRSIPVGRWPTADEPLALYRRPSATQLTVLDALARAHGCERAEGAVGVGHGRPIGRPNIEPEVTAEQAALFDAVDRSRGDSLLWCSWLTAPPDVWFD